MPKIVLPGGVQFDGVPKWAVAACALMIAAVVVLIGIWTKVYQPEIELVTAKEATEAAREEIAEFSKHISGTDVEHEHKFTEKPLLLARLYKDRCILLVSETPEGERSMFVRDMSKDPHKVPRHTFNMPFLHLPVVEAAQRTNCDGRVHPGAFREDVGVKNGCWVPVFRTYYDGCVSQQWFDACNRIMDGRITWRICKH